MNRMMSFSPVRSTPASRSTSPPETGASQEYSTRWPPSPDKSNDIVADAKARLAAISQHFSEPKQKSEVQAPVKTKLVTKISPKIDNRQAALNKLAAKRIALAKSKAKTTSSTATAAKPSSPGKASETAEAAENTKKQQASVSQAILAPTVTLGAEKPTASIAPIMASRASLVTSCSQQREADSGSSALARAMEATLLTQTQSSTSSHAIAQPPPSANQGTNCECHLHVHVYHTVLLYYPY